MQAHDRKDAVSSLCRNWRDHRTDHIESLKSAKSQGVPVHVFVAPPTTNRPCSYVPISTAPSTQLL
jgi:hypothetical protein